MMADGLIVADGTTAEIRATATGRRVQAYVPAARQGEAVAALEAMPEVLSVTADAGRLVVTAADSDAVARTLLTGLGAHDLEISVGSMDDAFRLLTERNAS
jgi:ABC-2 type transport system ATP-binding protein